MARGILPTFLVVHGPCVLQVCKRQSPAGLGILVLGLMLLALLLLHIMPTRSIRAREQWEAAYFLHHHDKKGFFK